MIKNSFNRYNAITKILDVFMIIKTKHLILRSFHNGDEFDLLEYLKEVTVNCFIDMKINKN